MTSKSYYWREELLQIANSLEQQRAQKDFPRNYFVSFEKDIAFSFYIIQKLGCFNLLKNTYLEKEVKCVIIPNKGVPFEITCDSQIEDYFDFEKVVKSKITLEKLCESVIHSKYFSPVFNDDFLLNAFFVFSDYNRNKDLVVSM